MRPYTLVKQIVANFVLYITVNYTVLYTSGAECTVAMRSCILKGEKGGALRTASLTILAMAWMASIG